MLYIFAVRSQRCFRTRSNHWGAIRHEPVPAAPSASARQHCGRGALRAFRWRRGRAQRKGRGGERRGAPDAVAMAAVAEERREPEWDGGCEHYRRGCLLRVRWRRQRERGGPRGCAGVEPRGAVAGAVLREAVPLPAVPRRRRGAPPGPLPRGRGAVRALPPPAEGARGRGGAAARGRRRHFGRGRAALR